MHVRFYVWAKSGWAGTPPAPELTRYSEEAQTTEAAGAPRLLPPVRHVGEQAALCWPSWERLAASWRPSLRQDGVDCSLLCFGCAYTPVVFTGEVSLCPLPRGLALARNSWKPPRSESFLPAFPPPGWWTSPCGWLKPLPPPDAGALCCLSSPAGAGRAPGRSGSLCRTALQFLDRADRSLLGRQTAPPLRLPGLHRPVCPVHRPSQRSFLQKDKDITFTRSVASAAKRNPEIQLSDGKMGPCNRFAAVKGACR